MPIVFIHSIIYRAVASCQVQASGAMSSLDPTASLSMAPEACPGPSLLHSKARLDELFLDYRQGARKLGKDPSLALS